MKPRWVRRIIWIVATAIICLLLAVCLLVSPPGQRLTFNLLSRYLRHNAGIILEASAVEIAYRRGAVNIEGLTVRAASAPELPPLGRIERLELDISLIDALRGQLVIELLALSRPDIYYFADMNGHDNLPVFPTPVAGNGGRPDLLLLRAEVRDGTFRFEDRTRDLTITVPAWKVAVAGDAEKHTHHIDFALQQSADISSGTFALPVRDVHWRGEVNLSRSELAITSASVAIDGASVDVAGTVTFAAGAEPTLALTIQPVVDLAQAARLGQPRYLPQGRLSGIIQAEGPLTTPRMTARLDITNVSFRSWHQPRLDFSAQANWQTGAGTSGGTLIFPAFALTSSAGGVTGKAAFYGDSGKNSITLNISNLNLLPWGELADLPFSLASRAAGQVELQWQGDFSPEALRGTARLELIAETPKSDQELPLAGEVRASMRKGRFEITVPTLQALDLETSGKFTFQDFRDITGTLTGTVTDVGQTLPRLTRLLGQTELPVVATDWRGPAQFSLQAAGSWQQPLLTATIAAPELFFHDFNVNAGAWLRLSDNVLELRGDFALPDAATATIAGQLDFTAAEPVITVDARAERIPASLPGAIMEWPLDATDVRGMLAMTASLRGPLANLTGSACIAGADLALYEEPLGRLDAEFGLADRVLRLTELRLGPAAEASAALRATASYELDSGQFVIQARGQDWQLQGNRLPAELPRPGKINIEVSGAGTPQHPRLHAQISADEIRLPGIDATTTLGSLTLQADLQDDELNVSAKAPRLQLSASARATLADTFPFTGEMHLVETDLGAFGIKLRDGQPLEGQFTANLQAEGALKNPQEAVLNAHVTALALRAGGQEARLFAPVRLQYHDQALEFLSPALMVTRTSQLEASGRMPLAATGVRETLQLRGRVDLTEALSFALLPDGLSVAGALDLDMRVNILDGVFGGEGKIAVERAEMQIPGSPLPLSDINVRTSVENGAIIIEDATARWGEGKITLSGEFPFSALPQPIPGLIARDGPVQFSLVLTDLTPEMTGMFPPDLTGHLSLRATGSAARANLASLRAEVVFDAIDFAVDALEFTQPETSSVIISDGVATISQLALIGPETNLRFTGSAGLLSGAAPLSLRLEGYLDAALLTFGDPDLKASGRLDINAAAGGTLSDPIFSGYAETSNGRLALRNPRIVADDLRVRLAITPEAFTVERLTGLLNGGTLTGSGSLGYRRGFGRDIDLRATFEDCFLEAPAGLRSASSGTITLTSDEDAIVIGGNVRVTESSYRESLEVGGQVMNYLKAQQVVVADATPNPLLSRIRYDIGVRTVTPLLVQNNVAHVEATASNLRVVGTFYEPSVTGRITLAEGGEIILNQREYYLERGVITFVNQSRVEPELEIEAQTKVAEYDITMQLTGNVDRMSTVLTSEPVLPERDIMSLLVTGRTSAETQGQEIQVMQSQALSLLAGQAGEQLTGEARKALHLSTFRIDPGLISSESDPGARLTLGEDITRQFSLAYSMNLVNGGDQIWAAQYAFPRRLTTQATKQQDNSYRFEFRHDIRFGGGERRRPRPGRNGRNTAASATGVDGERARRRTAGTKFVIGAIRFTGEPLYDAKELQDRLRAEPGDRYDFARIQKGLDRLQQFYLRDHRLEADIRLKRETKDNSVNLELAIASGPVVRFSYEGFPVSADTRRAVEKAWTDGIFEAGRTEDSASVLRRQLIAAGYYEAVITPTVETSDGVRLVRFQIDQGARYTDVTLEFPGARQIAAPELLEALKRANLKLDVYADPGKVTAFLQSYYRERGYLNVQVMNPQSDLNAARGVGKVAIEVREGPLFIIGELQFTGNQAFDYDQLWVTIPTSSGSSYDPNTLRAAVKAIETLYHSYGYNEMSATFRVVQDTSKALANLTFQIVERRQSFIGDVVVEGNQRTSMNFVTHQLDFQTGDILNFEKINESRRRLYATGVYSSVDFQTEEINAASAGSASAGSASAGSASAGSASAGSATASSETRRNMRVRLRLRENPPYRVQYGLFYDTERGPGGLVEAQNMNVLGRASNLGFRLRYDTDLKEGRLYYNQPFVRQLHLKLDSSAFMQREERSSYRARRIGFSLMQERSLPKAYRLDYGYRYDHVRWEPETVALDPTIFQANVPVARLIATLTRDTRDNVLDATKGEFSAHTLEFGPEWLGSEIGFARYSGQYFRYVPLDKFLRLPTKDKDGGAIPTRFVYAGALRLGLTASFGGGDIISPERFFAGGGTTMRGFEQDKLGPLERQADGSLRPRGGEGLFLFNNEIRFPIWGILHGVAFADIGNVYERLSDFNFNLRKTAGAGLRLKIKFIPLRFDYGFKLDRKPGESARAFFFSIGQAF